MGRFKGLKPTYPYLAVIAGWLVLGGLLVIGLQVDSNAEYHVSERIAMVDLAKPLWLDDWQEDDLSDPQQNTFVITVETHPRGVRVGWESNPSNMRGYQRFRGTDESNLLPNGSSHWDPRYTGPIVTEFVDINSSSGQRYCYRVELLDGGWPDNSQVLATSNVACALAGGTPVIGTPTPTPTVTPTPTITPTPSQTATPSVTPTPSNTPTITPTKTATPTRIPIRRPPATDTGTNYGYPHSHRDAGTNEYGYPHSHRDADTGAVAGTNCSAATADRNSGARTRFAPINRHRQGSCHRDAHSHRDSFGHTDTNEYSDSHTHFHQHANRHTDGNPVTNTYSEPNIDIFTNLHADTYQHPHTHTHQHSHADQYVNSDVYSYTYVHSDTNAYVYTTTNSDADCHTVPDANPYAIADTYCCSDTGGDYSDHRSP